MGFEAVRAVYALREDDGHAGLVNSRKSVLACIAFHANHQTSKCSLKYETIARELGLSVSSVAKAVKWLVAEGYIARGNRKRRKNGTLGSYTFTLQPPAVFPAGPPGNTAENHPEYFRRSNPLHEPTASSSTQSKTAEGEEEGSIIEAETAGDLADLSSERPLPDRAAGAVKVAGCRCDPPRHSTYVDEDGGRCCLACSKPRLAAAA